MGADTAAGRGEGDTMTKRAATQHQMVLELKKMGFSTAAVAQACRRCSTTKDAVDWLLEQHSDVFCRVETGHPMGLRDQGLPGFAAVSQSDDPQVQAPPAPGSSVDLRQSDQSADSARSPLPSFSGLSRPLSKPPGSNV